MKSMNSPIPLILIVAGSITLGAIIGGNITISTPIASNNFNTEKPEEPEEPEVIRSSRDIDIPGRCRVAKGSDGLYYPLYNDGSPHSFGEATKSEAFEACRKYREFVISKKIRTYEEL